MANDSIRDALMGAFDASEKDEPIDAATGAADTSTDTSADTDTSYEQKSDTTDTSAVETAPAIGDGQPAPVAAPTADDRKAPASWNKEERDGWASVPKAARDAVLRRETEMNRALQASADARRRVGAIEAMSEPYKPLLDRYGVSVEQALPPLLATRAALEVGTPQQKAMLVANIVGDFGIDPELLDQALFTRLSGRGYSQQQAPAQRLDPQQIPELAPLFQIAQELQSRRVEQATNAINEVSSLDHFEDVRMTMADLMDRAKDLGKSLPLRDAYDTACRIHGLAAAPSQVAQTRDDQGRFAASRRAASSIGGAPVPTAPRRPGEGSLREELEANFAKRR